MFVLFIFISVSANTSIPQATLMLAYLPFFRFDKEDNICQGGQLDIML